MDFGELMGRFGEDFGLEGFGPGEDGAWSVEIDGMPISFVELADPPRVRMTAPVCDLPEKGVGAFSQVLLEAMFMGRATGGAHFFVEQGEPMVFLQRTDPLPALDLEGFKAVLERFVNILEQWRQLGSEFRATGMDLDKVRLAAAQEAQQMSADGFMRV